MDLIEMLQMLMANQQRQSRFPTGRGAQFTPWAQRPMPAPGMYQQQAQALDAQRRAMMMQMQNQALQGGMVSTPQSGYAPPQMDQMQAQMQMDQQKNQMAGAYQQAQGYAPPVQNPMAQAQKLALFNKAQQMQNYLPVQPPAV